MARKNLKKGRRVELLMDDNTYQFLKNSADVYSEGNISVWIRHCIFNYEPKYLNKKAPKKEAQSKEK